MKEERATRWLGLGELAVLQGQRAGVTGLGSCIAMAVMEEPPSRLAVALHIVYPGEGPGPHYAETAVQEALDRLARLGHGLRLKAWLAGAATLFSNLPDPVGPKLAQSVLETLSARGIEVAEADLGGVRARRVTFDPLTKKMSIAYGPSLLCG
jgi:chemotaxis receptor (MCP) glutamine deamidase CheD